MSADESIVPILRRLLRTPVRAELDQALGILRDDETLFVEGERLRVERTSSTAPRVVSDRRLLINPPYAAEDVSNLCDGVRGQLMLMCGLGEGELVRAAVAAGAITCTVELDDAKVATAPDLIRVDNLDAAARETAAGRSVIFVGNAVALVEAMVQRGFTPAFGCDAIGDGRVPEGYSRHAADVLAARNPLELARVRLLSRERFAVAWRTLTERGMRERARPTADRARWFALGAGPRKLLHRRRAHESSFAALRDLARGAAYVDPEGSCVIAVDAAETPEQWNQGLDIR